jgi:hypothetical protein
MRSAVGLGLVAVGVALAVHTFVRLAQVPDTAGLASPSLSTLADADAAARGVARPANTSPPAERRVSAALVEVAPTRTIASPPASAPEQPRGPDLIRALQRELRRTGCYAGRVNGEWTRSTQSAMKAFTARVNASLPVDRPDIVLLALLQGERGVACGSCPAGQQLGPGGDCLPAAILARTARSEAATHEPAVVEGRRPAASSRIVATRALAPTGVNSAPPIEGRMSVGGPKPASVEHSPPGALAVAVPSHGGTHQATAGDARRSAGHRAHRLVRARGHAYPPPRRYAYRPVFGLRGVAAFLFGPARY